MNTSTNSIQHKKLNLWVWLILIRKKKVIKCLLRLHLLIRIDKICFVKKISE